jgi:adenosylmethionine-8-amino-7-oxononanoate aminotransferase
MPLAATLASAAIFDAHYSTDRSRMFFHSSSYTANPLACAVALANTRIWQEEPVRERIATLSRWQSEGLARLADHPYLCRQRQTGTIAAMDLRGVAGATGGYLADVSLRLRQAFLDRDILLRPLGSTLYIMPPYCTTNEDMDRLYNSIDEVVRVFAES